MEDALSYAESFRPQVAAMMEGLQNSEENFALRNIEEFADFIQKPKLQIAVVGAIKAGKSSLLNALFGREIASVAVVPETACLSVFKYSEQNYFRAVFYNETEWDELWQSVEDSSDKTFADKYFELGADKLRAQYIGASEQHQSFARIEQLRDELEKYTSAKAPIHLFVKELEVGFSSYPLGKDVYFVDTPGLNDVVRYRSDVTKNFIRKSNAVIVCVNSDAMRNDEYTTIIKAKEIVGDHAEKLLIVGTKIDKLNNPAEDWEKQKIEWQNYFPNTKLKHFIGVSSYVFSIVKKIEDGKAFVDSELTCVKEFLGHYQKNVFSPNSFWGKLKNLFSSDEKTIKKRRNFIYEKTNIPEILNKLQSGPLKDPMAELHREIDRKYKNMLSFYGQEIARKKLSLEEDRKLLAAGIKEQNAKISELEEQNAKLDTGKNLMLDFMAKCRRAGKQTIADFKAEIENMIEE